MTDDERMVQLEQALKATKDEGTSAQVAAAKKVLMTAPSQQAADGMWLFLVRGLVVLLGISLIGIIYLIATDDYRDVLLTVFTALLTGLIGLFVDNPAKTGQ